MPDTQYCLKDATIIIPTHNRKDFLLRLLDYYQPVLGSVIVADSSNSKLDSSEIPSGIRYIHLPNISFTEKMCKALSVTNTKYIQIVADDDFVLLDALQEGIKFLEQNDDYGSLQGWHLGFVYNPPSKFPLLRIFDDSNLSIIGLHLFAKDEQISSDDSLERIKTGLNPYMNRFYALHRKEVLESFFFDLCARLEDCKAIDNLVLQEIAQAINSLYWGKHRILQRPWIYRELLTFSLSGSEIFPLNKIRDQGDPIYEGFIASLADHFVELNLPQTKLEDQLKQFMNAYIDDFSPRWEAGEIPHSCAPSIMVYESEEIARMEEIKKVVMRHSAQLDPNWNQIKFRTKCLVYFRYFSQKVKAKYQRLFLSPRKSHSARNLLASNPLTSNTFYFLKGRILDIRSIFYRIYFHAYQLFRRVRNKIK